MTGKAITFFSHQAVWVDFNMHGEVKQANIAKTQTREDVAEKVRSRIVSNAKSGT